MSYFTNYGAGSGYQYGSGKIAKWWDVGYVLSSPVYAGVGILETCDIDTYNCRYTNSYKKSSKIAVI